MGETTVVSVSHNTRELSALLLWSLHRILEPSDLSVVMVDNASTDGTTDMLLRAQDAGLCTVIVNRFNLGHGPALDIAAHAEVTRPAARLWFLDSDCVIARPDALRAPLAAHPDAAIIGEAQWDPWHRRSRPELYSLIVSRSALDRPDVAGFADDGDPAWEMLLSAERAGVPSASFPFTVGEFIVHLGRASLAAAVAANDTPNPLYEWASEHHEPHFGGVDGARERHAEIVEWFEDEVGPELDLVAALRA